jgi:hypothetical protein
MRSLGSDDVLKLALKNGTPNGLASSVTKCNVAMVKRQLLLLQMSARAFSSVGVRLVESKYML